MQAFPKRKLVIGGTVIALAAGAGGALAATQGSSNPRQQYLNDVARRLNVTPAQLSSALQGAAIDQLEAAVKAGKLTQAQANALKQRIQQGAAGGAPFLGPPGPGGLVGPGGLIGPGGPGPRAFGFGLGRAVFFGPDAPAAAVAKFLGLTEAQLLKQLQNGKSLADIAKAQGKTTAGLEQAITAAAKTRLDKAVANKNLTAAQEQKILSQLSARMNDLVNNTPPKGALGLLGFGRPAIVRPFAEITGAAKYLGLTNAQLRTQLRSGKTLAQIAKAQGKTTAGLEQAITASIKARLDKAVANKKLTSAQEQKLLKALSTGIDAMVTGTPPLGPRFARPGLGYQKAFRGRFARPGSFTPAAPAPGAPALGAPAPAGPFA